MKANKEQTESELIYEATSNAEEIIKYCKRFHDDNEWECGEECPFLLQPDNDCTIGYPCNWDIFFALEKASNLEQEELDEMPDSDFDVGGWKRGE